MKIINRSAVSAGVFKIKDQDIMQCAFYYIDMQYSCTLPDVQ